MLISTTDGCVYVFKLISDYELAAHISQQRDAGTSQKIWSYLAPVIPKNISSLTMTSSTVKVDLKEIKNVTQQDKNEVKKEEKNKFLNELKMNLLFEPD